jgi:hypothetical protein
MSTLSFLNEHEKQAIQSITALNEAYFFVIAHYPNIAQISEACGNINRAYDSDKRAITGLEQYYNFCTDLADLNDILQIAINLAKQHNFSCNDKLQHNDDTLQNTQKFNKSLSQAIDLFGRLTSYDIKHAPLLDYVELSGKNSFESLHTDVFTASE